MKKAEIQRHGLYTAKMSGKLTTVRVDDIRIRAGYRNDTTVYDVTNLATGRKSTFRSAMRFRRAATNFTNFAPLDALIAEVLQPG